MHLRIDSGRTAPARPSARAPGSRAAPIASAPAAHASGNRGSHQSSATRAAQQVPTASSSSAPQNRTRSPVSSARPLCPSHGPSRAAASHLHSEPRHALHTAHTRPPETDTHMAPVARSMRIFTAAMSLAVCVYTSPASPRPSHDGHAHKDIFQGTLSVQAQGAVVRRNYFRIYMYKRG